MLTATVLRRCLRMHALKKPVGGNFPTGALGFGLLQDRRADGGELKADTDIVEKAGFLIRALATGNFACDKFLERRGSHPKRMLDFHLVRMCRPLADDIDGI